jgi:hypothetical protein
MQCASGGSRVSFSGHDLTELLWQISLASWPAGGTMPGSRPAEMTVDLHVADKV